MFKKAIVTAALCVVGTHAFGFALLGPYTSWMTHSNGYRAKGDLGGPMNLGEEYRWNLPVITYGFDSEFIEYFGSAGVDAVESAVAVLTNLPAASEINLQDFGFDSTYVNFEAEALGLFDLKSATLKALLYQLGLAECSRYAWTIRERAEDPQTSTVIQRNFDPATLLPSDAVNEVQYVYRIFAFADGSADAIESPVDPLAIFPFNAVTDHRLEMGRAFSGLTRDDVGGLRYLYSRENVNVEPLPPGVTELDGTTRPQPDLAARPGIEKLQFLRMDWNTNTAAFNAITSVFQLAYVTNGVIATQHVQRVVTEPDIIFQVRDLGGEKGRDNNPPEYYFVAKPFEASTTARWQNLSALNGTNWDAGPGVIPPGARLTYGKLAKYSGLGFYDFGKWGSFDWTAEEPIIYHGDEIAQTVTLDHYVERDTTNTYFKAVLLGTPDAIYQINCSTNLTDWTLFTTVTNNQSFYAYFSFRDVVTEPKKFYRAVRVE